MRFNAAANSGRLDQVDMDMPKSLGELIFVEKSENILVLGPILAVNLSFIIASL